MTSQAPTTTTLRVQVNVPHVLTFLGGLYASPLAPLAEAVDNAADSGASEIQIRLTTSSVAVIDNGMGFSRGILKADQEVLDALTASGRTAPRDLLQAVSEYSLASFEWAMMYTGLSGKLLAAREGVRGRRGIGIWSFLMWARSVSVTSRMSPHLALLGGIKGEYPAYVLRPPSREDLERGDTSCTIEEASLGVRDAWGKLLSCGTRLEIHGVDLESEGLRPGVLEDYLSARFGQAIREGRFELTIVDQATRQGRAVQGGRIIRVTPPIYRGYLVWESPETPLAGGDGFVSGEIYYQPGATAGKVMLRLLGSDVCSLTEVAALNVLPWNSGSYMGYLTYVRFPKGSKGDEGSLLDPGKQRPNTSLVFFSRYLKTVSAIAAKVVEASGQKDRERARRDLGEIGDDTAAAVRAAIREIRSVSGRRLGAEAGTGRKSQKKKRRGTGRFERFIRVAVLNEHDEGVPGIELTLILGGEIVALKTTGDSGQIHFGQSVLLDEDGEYCYGLYIVRMNPRGFRVVGRAEHKVEIGRNDREPGAALFFHLETGQPKRKSANWSEDFRVWIHALDDPERLCGFRPGVIEINEAYASLAQAFADEDWVKVDSLIAAACAEVIAANMIEGDKAYVAAQQTKLFDAIHNHLRVIRQKRKQRAKARAKKLTGEKKK